MKGKFIIYQILLRVFANTNENWVSGGSLQLNGSGRFSDITDKVLSSLKSLHVTHIWYTGVIEHATRSSFGQINLKGDNPLVVKGEAGSPYAIKDYYDVNPYLADNPAKRMEEFTALVERTHKAGLKVILDFVPNHVSRVYKSDVRPELDFGREDDTSVAFLPSNNFYYLPGESFNAAAITDDRSLRESYSEFPAKATGNDCFSASPGRNDWYETVKLNYGVDYMHGCEPHFNPIPRSWKMMVQILLYWVEKGVDGFRCDMAEMVPVEFWSYAIKETRRVNSQILFIAEAYNPANYERYLNSGFNYIYDKVGLYDKLRQISRGEAAAEQITKCWQSIDKIQGRMLNFLENHDEQRIASEFNLSDPFKALPELAVSLLLNTAPFMLYFGQEVGERGMECEGYGGRDGRTSIFDYCQAPAVRNYFKYLSGMGEWEGVEPKSRELYSLYSRMLGISLSEEAVREGYTFDLEYVNANSPSNPDFDSHRHFAFARRSRPGMEKGGKESLIFVAVDFLQNTKHLSLFLPKYLFECWNIREGNYKYINLLGEERGTVDLGSDSFIELKFDRYGVAILKIELE